MAHGRRHALPGSYHRYVDAGNTPAWTGIGAAGAGAQRSRGLASPEDVARTSLLLLPTSGPLAAVSWTDWCQAAVVGLMPEVLLSAVVYDRHARQRADLQERLKLG